MPEAVLPLDARTADGHPALLDALFAKLPRASRSGTASGARAVSIAHQPDEPRVRVYLPDEALQHAQPLPPRERLVIEDVPQDGWTAFQEALAEV